MIKAILSSATDNAAPVAAEYSLAPNVVLILVQDGTARLLDMVGQFYALTAVGAEMLQATLECNTPVAIDMIASHHGVEATQVHADLNAFLQELERRRLIYRAESRRSSRGSKARVPFLILAPALRFIHTHRHSTKAKVWGLLLLARLSFRLFGWTNTIDVWRRYHRQLSEHVSAHEREDLVKVIDETVRAAAAEHVFDMGCKERSLCCWTLLQCAGIPAAVVLGINLFPMASHCWCESDARILSDYQDQCQKFTPVLRYE